MNHSNIIIVDELNSDTHKQAKQETTSDKGSQRIKTTAVAIAVVKAAQKYQHLTLCLPHRVEEFLHILCLLVKDSWRFIY